MRGPGRITNRNATSHRPQQHEVCGGKKAGGKRVSHHALGARQVVSRRVDEVSAYHCIQMRAGSGDFFPPQGRRASGLFRTGRKQKARPSTPSSVVYACELKADTCMLGVVSATRAYWLGYHMARAIGLTVDARFQRRRPVAVRPGAVDQLPRLVA